MYILIVLPKAFQWEDCHDITINPKVPFSKIFSIEEALKNLNKLLLNLLEEFQNLLFKYKHCEFSLEKKLSGYVIRECNVTISLKEGEEMYENVRSELKQYKLLRKSTNIINELKNGIELIFLDSFCVICEPKKEMSLITALKRLGVKESSEKIRSDKMHVYYRVYCIKSETGAIIESLNDTKNRFKCVKVENINEKKSNETKSNKENSEETSNNNATNDKYSEQDNNKEIYNCEKNIDGVINIIKNKQDPESEYVDFLVKKANDTSKAYLNTLFARAFVESMQRYGTSACLKYKIVKIKEKKYSKYCRKIAKELRAQKIIEEMSDEEEYPFTQHVIFKKVEDGENLSKIIIPTSNRNLLKYVKYD